MALLYCLCTACLTGRRPLKFVCEASCNVKHGAAIKVGGPCIPQLRAGSLVHRSLTLLCGHSPACKVVERCDLCVLLMCRVKAACPAMAAEVLCGLHIKPKVYRLNKSSAKHRPLAALSQCSYPLQAAKFILLAFPVKSLICGSLKARL